jgi:two-component system phosphate regulon sensor histidine kinase PhoR
MRWRTDYPLVVAVVVAAALLAVAAIIWPHAELRPWAAPLVLSAFAVLGLGYAFRLTRTRLSADIASRSKRAELYERQLRRQKEAIDALADGLDVAIFLCSQDGTIEYANRKSCQMFGFDDPAGRPLIAVTLSHDLERLILRAIKGREAVAEEIILRSQDDGVGLARAWPEPPDLERVFLSIYEITHLRRLERVRRDFVANVSHELRTPMTTIRAMAETLAEDGDDANLRRRYLDRIVTEVDRLTGITDDLLTLSMAESQVVDKAPCDLVHTVREVMGQLVAKADEKKLSLGLDSPERLIIMANPGQMTQVALNLIDNAISYTSEGSVSVRLTKVADHALLTVTDTGIGISVEHQQRVFERFYRVDKARSRASGGTGLGLSIVKHIVEAHGGRVAVDSELNKGSTFRVELPIGAAQRNAQSL